MQRYLLGGDQAADKQKNAIHVCTNDKNTYLISYCTPEEKELQLRKTYLIATERDFPAQFKTILEYCLRSDSSNSPSDNSVVSGLQEDKSDQAALLIGNSYILSTLLSLPESIRTIYLCDLNQAVLKYAFHLIKIVNEADNYESFKKALAELNKKSHDEEKGQTNLVKPEMYTEEEWLKEKFLDETSFDRYKNKIKKTSITIHYSHINLFDNGQAKKLIGKIREDNNKIVVINYSNIHQFTGAQQGGFASLASLLKEVTVAQLLSFYSIYIPAYNPFNAPKLLYYKGCPQKHAERLKDLHYFARSRDKKEKLKAAIDRLRGSAIGDEKQVEEEEVFRKYNADQLDSDALLQHLDQAMEKHDKASPMYKAAQLVREEAENVSRVMPEGDLKKWKMSVVLALNVLEIPKGSPEYPNAVRLLKANADHRAIGKSDGWKKFKGALAMLAGAAIIGLSIAGIPFTGGASLAGFYVAGSLLTVGGAAFFYYNRQKSLAKKTATLAKKANC